MRNLTVTEFDQVNGGGPTGFTLGLMGAVIGGVGGLVMAQFAAVPLILINFDTAPDKHLMNALGAFSVGGGAMFGFSIGYAIGDGIERGYKMLAKD